MEALQQIVDEQQRALAEQRRQIAEQQAVLARRSVRIARYAAMGPDDACGGRGRMNARPATCSFGTALRPVLTKPIHTVPVTHSTRRRMVRR